MPCCSRLLIRYMVVLYAATISYHPMESQLCPIYLHVIIRHQGGNECRLYFISANAMPVHVLSPDLNVEGEPFRLAAFGHHLVHRSHRRLLCCDRPSRRIRSESRIVRKSLFIAFGLKSESPVPRGMLEVCGADVFASSIRCLNGSIFL